MEYVLDDVRGDVAKCAGLGTYLVGGAWALIVGLKWLVAQTHGAKAPVTVSGGLLLFFLFTAGVLAKLLWPDIDKAEIIVMLIGALIGIFALAG